jgi:hypothetical protein
MLQEPVSKVKAGVRRQSEHFDGANEEYRRERKRFVRCRGQDSAFRGRPILSWPRAGKVQPNRLSSFAASQLIDIS